MSSRQPILDGDGAGNNFVVPYPPSARVTKQRLTGDDRCWPCTIANTAVGVLVGWLPLGAALVRGRRSMIALAMVWAMAVTAYTGYRLVALGYLPHAETVAKWTGLHDRIGPGSRAGSGSAEDEK